MGETEKRTVGDAEVEARKSGNPFMGVFRLLVGPRVDGAANSKAWMYMTFLLAFIAILNTCTARNLAVWNRKNSRPHIVYADPSGNMWQVKTRDADVEPVVGEKWIRNSIYRVTQMNFEVLPDLAGRYQKYLVDFFYTGDALKKLKSTSDNVNWLGSTAEKAEVIASGRRRELEIISMDVRMGKMDPDIEGQAGTAEVIFYARTYNRGSSEPEVQRTYRVRYAFVLGASLPTNLTGVAVEIFDDENPARLRVTSVTLDEQASGAVPQTPGNVGPEAGPQSGALSPEGSWPTPAAARKGGPAGTMDLPGSVKPAFSPSPKK